MADLRLPSGAYIIRNKQAVADSCLDVQDKKVTVAVQEPHRRRERQIWWVEALIDYEDDTEKGAVYSIRNISDEEALDSKGWKGFGLDLTTDTSNGMLWQKWRIVRVVDDKEGREFYNILSLQDGGAVDIAGSPVIGSHVREFKLNPLNHQQRWEFIVPVVPVPPGWVQIRSAPINGHQLLLQQEYITAPPFLGPETDPSSPLSKRTNWGNQWTFFLDNKNDGSLQNYWYIQNRLTGGLLGYHKQVYKNGREINVAAGWTSRSRGWPNICWMLKRQRDGFWSIVNKANGLVLESFVVSGGAGVKTERKGGDESDRWKWEFV
ncbi:hypothetical protein RUND412_004675 [Rhizina undulata]